MLPILTICPFCDNILILNKNEMHCLVILINVSQVLNCFVNIIETINYIHTGRPFGMRVFSCILVPAISDGMRVLLESKNIIPAIYLAGMKVGWYEG